jgi:metallo-beta-lactamase family protein
VIHIPRWKERLILKPKESSFEKPSEEELPADVKTELLNSIVDLENEIKALRKRIQSVAGEEGVSGDEADRLKYVHEELRAILTE